MSMTLYKGFLIVEDEGVKAYRNKEYYYGDIPTYTASSISHMHSLIDGSGEVGEFALEHIDEVTSAIGRPLMEALISDRLKEGTRLIVVDKDGNQLFSTSVGDLNIWDADPVLALGKAIAEGLPDDAFKPT